MRRINFVLSLLLCALVLVSCGKKKEPTESEVFRSTLTAEDTTAMLKICDDCMKSLKAGDIDAALSQLHLYDDSTRTVKPLTPAKEKELRNTFTVFPVHDYTIDYYTFTTEGLNDVKYRIEFFEKADPESSEANTIGFMFNPVKVDGQWFLTVKEAHQDFDQLQR